MSVSAPLAAQVLRRAGGRCEYCQMSQSLQGATFHVEHIVPLSRGGATSEENLALACPSCNLHKADRQTAIDPETRSEVRLFHPRRDRWDEHFAWAGFEATGKTEMGRATLATLRFNHPRRLEIRKAEARFGIFPPR